MEDKAIQTRGTTSSKFSSWVQHLSILDSACEEFSCVIHEALDSALPIFRCYRKDTEMVNKAQRLADTIYSAVQ